MAAKKWMVLPGGRAKRWKQAHTAACESVPPRWFRNRLNRRDRRSAQRAVAIGDDRTYPYVHPHTASWYW